MQQSTESILEPILFEPIKRQQLIPWWIKVFCVLFMFMGGLSVLGLIGGLLGYQFQISLFGFETNEPISLIGLFICSLFILKGIVAYGLWNMKSWALSSAIVDAFISIGVCTLSMTVLPALGHPLTLRLELVLIIPYLLKLQKIKSHWNGNGVTHQAIANL